MIRGPLSDLAQLQRAPHLGSGRCDPLKCSCASCCPGRSTELHLQSSQPDCSLTVKCCTCHWPQQCMLPREAEDVLLCSYVATLSFPSLLGAICEGQWSGTEQGTRMMKGLVQVQAGGSSWEWWGGKEPAGAVGQVITCSFTTQAGVKMARLPPHHVFNLIFIPEHKPWQQIPACSACAGDVCSIGRSVALDQSKGLETRETQLLWDRM